MGPVVASVWCRLESSSRFQIPGPIAFAAQRRTLQLRKHEQGQCHCCRTHFSLLLETSFVASHPRLELSIDLSSRTVHLHLSRRSLPTHRRCKIHQNKASSRVRNRTPCRTSPCSLHISHCYTRQLRSHPRRGWSRFASRAPRRTCIGRSARQRRERSQFGFDINSRSCPTSLPPTGADVPPTCTPRLDITSSNPRSLCSTSPLSPPLVTYSDTGANHRSSWRQRQQL